MSVSFTDAGSAFGLMALGSAAKTTALSTVALSSAATVGLLLAFMAVKGGARDPGTSRAR
jgi:hypothetical protein